MMHRVWPVNEVDEHHTQGHTINAHHSTSAASATEGAAAVAAAHTDHQDGHVRRAAKLQTKPVRVQILAHQCGCMGPAYACDAMEPPMSPCHSRSPPL